MIPTGEVSTKRYTGFLEVSVPTVRNGPKGKLITFDQ